MSGTGVGGHQSAAMGSDTWLTPPDLLAALGPFDLDPCACPEPRPWPTAARMIARPEGDGLRAPWSGRVWLNPPYSSSVGPWLGRLARHGSGTALIFARTETSWFGDYVWRGAASLLFLAGRVAFRLPDGSPGKWTGGAPSVLAAYGPADAERLARCGLAGTLVTGWSVNGPRIADAPALFEQVAP